MSIYLSSAYLAPIEYYAILYNCSDICIERYENYIKQTYRNRCNILSANGIMPLTIPVESTGGKKCLIKDMCIAEHGNWRHLHWNALISAYNSTPFFEYYQDDFHPFYEKKYKFLFDFNEEFREMICGLIDDVHTSVAYTEEYERNKESIYDFRENISPKKDWKLYNPDYISVPYYQVFSERYGFVENLSIVDLLFNMGNESQLILKESIKRNTSDNTK